MDKEKTKQKIKELIVKYEEIKASGAVREYTEEDTKNSFIIPLFEALGWDFYNRKEITAEEHITGKRVDYGVYLNGIIKFFIEAKPLRADIYKEDYAEQAIKYSWNKGVTWAVLTDFESLIVFNALSPEKALHGKKYFEISYGEYLTRFDQLWLLSKEAFTENLLDQEAEKHGKKLQKVSVTESLSKDLNECRRILTEAFLQWNPKVSSELIDEGVQKLLDRLIFIRVAEDRKVEPPTLRSMVNEWIASGRDKHLYQRMTKKFRELDAIYNSNLFSEHPFEEWEEYSDATRDVIEILYGKKSYFEYDFSVIPADVLGSVYENYLGYKLQKSKKQKLIGENLELGKNLRKRKEQGIYYTPKFIVDYIVENALGPILDKCQTFSDLQKIKVLDPACGSGSFLVSAFNLILKKYEKFGRNPSDPFVRIMALEQNIYGVDLDQQAVELTRLNLLLNVFDSKIKLPNLGDNIKNGNSLISGSGEELEKYFGKNYRNKKPFNWQEEFSEVFKQGGFDVIIGNPPYIKEFVNKSAFDGLHNSPYYQGKMDLWTMFGCVSIDLLKDGGTLSFIAPNNWVTNAGASIFRDKILKDGELRTFIDFGDYKVFEQAGIQTMIFVFEKRKPRKKYVVDYIRILSKDIREVDLVNSIYEGKTKIEIEPEKLVRKSITFLTSESGSIFDKIQSKKNFELTENEVGQGIVAAPDKYFLEKNIDSYNKNEKNFLKPFYTASGKYKSGEVENYIFYISEKNFGDKKIKDYPNIEKHFQPFEKTLTEAKIKYGTPNKTYFYLHREREERFFNNGPKIVCGVRVKYPSFYFTEEQYYGSRALNFIKTERINPKYLTGILNSKLVFFWLKNKGKQLGDLLQVDKGPLIEIPICVGDEKQQKIMVAFVDKMLSLNKELHEAPENSDKWNTLKSEIEKTDRKIDGEVYKLYGLTDDEIKIVEKV